MPSRLIELNPVSRITVGAIGEPGRRTFYLQARRGPMLLTLVCEKDQVSELCIALQALLEELREKYPQGAKFRPLEESMELEQPFTPQFRIGRMGLVYDERRDLIGLIVTELLPPDVDPAEATTVRFFFTRAQADALSRHGLEVVARGRPRCPLCGRPINPDGSLDGFCPRRNGHLDMVVLA
ncbi:MAG: DUF3090 family protein [Thermoflexales bacterium]|nr:DUF3090 family protein [Thermoflexales bacterium]MCS7324392.1 DUF3090 family protein [Thermoflexales bacterium]MCX7937811.1 DUF3090 family protein [Thermoflexales bacterium]MDW8053283.1 DUF3090 domain-containing protein [Anaerolineae bacterium]MDW8291934.1 DUF3090 domain-containing protein [Anaerolineae bacterium]